MSNLDRPPGAVKLGDLTDMPTQDMTDSFDIKRYQVPEMEAMVEFSDPLSVSKGEGAQANLRAMIARFE